MKQCQDCGTNIPVYQQLFCESCWPDFLKEGHTKDKEPLISELTKINNQNQKPSMKILV